MILISRDCEIEWARQGWKPLDASSKVRRRNDARFSTKNYTLRLGKTRYTLGVSGHGVFSIHHSQWIAASRSRNCN
jgi:hypothetical protein